MSVKICPYCQCIILPSGKCRNSKCILGAQGQATIKQKELIHELCEELGIDISTRDPNKLTKEKASKLIKKLITRRVIEETYGSEVDED